MADPQDSESANGVSSSKPLPHVHEFKPRSKKVLLAKYIPEGGEMKYVNTTGADILKQYVCKCGKVETIDLERQRA